MIALLLAAALSALPNPKVTPGHVLTTDAKTICVPGYAKAHRNVSQATKREVLRRYGLDWSGCGTKCEIDHLISIELGGSNDADNLWPEMYAPTPGAHQKDIVENFLHANVCSGKVPLAKAQDVIRRNWIIFYEMMSSDQHAKAAKRR